MVRRTRAHQNVKNALPLRKDFSGIAGMAMVARVVTVWPDMPRPHHPLLIAGREFRSRLLLGTGKFSSNDAPAAALDASRCQIVTVGLRRDDLSGKRDPFAN